MKRKHRLYCRYPEWPETDKALWEAAFAPAMDPFDEGGAGAHLSPRTLAQLRYTWGKYLFFLAAKHPALLSRAPAEQFNAETIKEFVKSQPASCGGVTVSIYLFHLWLTLHYLCPRGEWSWLIAISHRVKAQAKPKPEQHHLVTSVTLYKLGLRLMDRALLMSNRRTSWRAQNTFRDGLIIALLALVPLRRRTLASLRIGKHLKKSGGQWFLDIPAEDVKTGRPLEYPIAPELSQRIDIYVDKIRPKTAGARTHDYLWASSRGRPMQGQVIYNAVREHTRRELGIPVNLQRFRRAAATLWSVRDPANARGAKDLLGHASFATTEKYYIMAQSRLAGRALERAIAARRVSRSLLGHQSKRTVAGHYTARDKRRRSGR